MSDLRNNRWSKMGTQTVLIVAMLALVGVATTGVVLAKSGNLAEATTAQRQAYTELFFAEPSALPETLAASTPLPVSFTITNRETARTTYHYTVTLTSATGVIGVSNGTVTLGDGQNATRQATIQLPTSGEQYRIDVRLVGKPQAIHWYLQS